VKVTRSDLFGAALVVCIGGFGSLVLFTLALMGLWMVVMR
jgi:hypothetical protein